MPELPEVETITRQLNDKLSGATITNVEVFFGNRLQPQKTFTKVTVGRKIVNIKRRAKLVVFCFDNGSAMIAHLKMTGHLIVHQQKPTIEKHDHVLFELTGSPSASHLLWSDIRKFGYLKIVSKGDLSDISKHYGPEPLEISAQELAKHIGTSRSNLKSTLLNQKRVAGIGNIYADEACFRARLRPTKSIAACSARDLLRLAEEIQKVLHESIAQKGTSANNYVDANGTRGGFLSLLRIYGRGGQPCVQCGTTIKKIVHAGRGTHFCPECQK